MKDKEAKSRLSSCEQELKAYTARLSELERLMQNLYEDKCARTIPQTVFQTLMRKYEAERAEKSEAIPELEHRVKSYLENQTDANRWLAIIRQYTEITELDESILFELVDRIEVGETKKSPWTADLRPPRLLPLCRECRCGAGKEYCRKRKYPGRKEAAA